MKSTTVLFSIFTLIFFACEKQKTEVELYSEHANDLIQKIVTERNCSCLIEVPNGSFREISKVENPTFNVDEYIITKLLLEKDSNLDSIEAKSKNFKFDESWLSMKDIRIIRVNELKHINTNADSAKSLLKKCPKGFFYISKPIFDKNFDVALIDFGTPFTCSKIQGFRSYRFINGEWILKKTAGNRR